MMDWRTYVYQVLKNNNTFKALVPEENILAGGSLETTPTVKPFVIIRMLPRVPALAEDAAHTARGEVWAHDEPGSYLLIDQVLAAAVAALVGPTGGTAGGIMVEWEGDGTDLFDDGYKTITRASSFKFTGSGR